MTHKRLRHIRGYVIDQRDRLTNCNLIGIELPLSGDNVAWSTKILRSYLVHLKFNAYIDIITSIMFFVLIPRSFSLIYC